MMATGRRTAASEKGAIIALFVFMMVPILLLVTLAVDGFLFLTADLQQDNNAEYAAEAAALQLWIRPAQYPALDPDGNGCPNQERVSGVCDSGAFSSEDARIMANLVSGSNLYVLGAGAESDLTSGGTFNVGCWTGSEFLVSVGSNEPACLAGQFQAVRVVLGVNSSARIVPILGKMFFSGVLQPRASAVAYVNVAKTTVTVLRNV